MDLQKTTVAKEPSGELRVEIAIGDTLCSERTRRMYPRVSAQNFSLAIVGFRRRRLEWDTNTPSR
jgi:hypothetical protein